MTPRRPDESDAEYMGRLAGDGVVIDMLTFTGQPADRAAYHFSMVAGLGRKRGFDEPGLDGWQRRSAFVRGVDVGSQMASAAIGMAASIEQLSAAEVHARIGTELAAAFDVISKFSAAPRDTSESIPQADIDAVTAASATVAERLKSAIEALKAGPQTQEVKAR